MFVSAPRSVQSAHPRRPALIEDRIPLPGRFLLADPARVGSLHQQAGLSVRQIAARLGVSHSAGARGPRKARGWSASGRAAATRSEARYRAAGTLESGRLVKNAGEQQVIRLIRQLHGGGRSLNAIARELNRRLVPTKNTGLWKANIVGKILRRL